MFFLVFCWCGLGLVWVFFGVVLVLKGAGVKIDKDNGVWDNEVWDNYVYD